MKNIAFQNTRTLYTPENKKLVIENTPDGPKSIVSLLFRGSDDKTFLAVINNREVSLPTTTVRDGEGPRDALIRLLKRVFKLNIENLPTINQVALHITPINNEVHYCFTFSKLIPMDILTPMESISPNITGLYTGVHTLLPLGNLPIPYERSYALGIALTATVEPECLLAQVDISEKLDVVRLESPWVQAHSTLTRLGFHLDWYYHNFLTENAYLDYLLKVASLNGLSVLALSDLNHLANESNLFVRVPVYELDVVVVFPKFIEQPNGEIKSHTATSVTFEDGSTFPIVGRLVK